MSKLPYRTYRKYIKKKFGGKVLKVSINGGFYCPNRDGTVASGGCLFCDNISFSMAADKNAPVIEQLKEIISCRINQTAMFIAYLQPYTNTYAPVDKLRKIYDTISDVEGVVGIAIGTRPDCLGDDVCDYLSELNSRTYLSVEIGLQSSSDRVLKLNNRGHTYSDFVEAFKRLKKRNIEVVAHCMIGMYGDTFETIVKTASDMASLGVDGLKIHQQMVIKNTPLEKLYRSGRLKILDVEEYAQLLGEFLCRLSPDQYIHRIMADSKVEYGLVAPMWSSKKAESLQNIRTYLEKHNLFQGKLFGR